MSTDDHDENTACARRKRDVESYLRGEAPAPAELICAPQLHGWRAVIVRYGSNSGRSRLLMVLIGFVTGHPRHDNGRFIHTSEVIWLDRHRNWARSWNRLYRLGTPASEGANAEESEENAA